MANGNAVPAELSKFVLEVQPDSLPIDSRINLLNAKIGIFIDMGDKTNALQLIKTMIDGNAYDTLTVGRYYSILVGLDNGIATAEKTLLMAINDSSSNNELDTETLYDWLQNCYALKGDVQKALSIYANHLLKPNMLRRKYLVNYARLQKYLGNSLEVKNSCTDVLSDKYFQQPLTKEDYYYCGFAQYLLGITERALYDYERSNKFDRYYSVFES